MSKTKEDMKQALRQAVRQHQEGGCDLYKVDLMLEAAILMYDPDNHKEARQQIREAIAEVRDEDDLFIYEFDKREVRLKRDYRQALKHAESHLTNDTDRELIAALYLLSFSMDRHPTKVIDTVLQVIHEAK